MTTLEKFVSFTEALSPERRRLMEEVLEDLMADSAEEDFTPDQLTELERRLADPDPKYADPEAVEALFRRHGVR